MIYEALTYTDYQLPKFNAQGFKMSHPAFGKLQTAQTTKQAECSESHCLLHLFHLKVQIIRFSKLKELIQHSKLYLPT